MFNDPNTDEQLKEELGKPASDINEPSVPQTMALPHELKITLESPLAPSETATASTFSLKTTVDILLANLYILIISMGLFAGIGFVVGNWYVNRTQTYTGRVRALIMFAFPEAELGLDPLGNPMNANAIRSPFVLSNALDELNFREKGISADAVRNNFRINSLVPRDVLDRYLLIHELAARVPARLEEIEEVIHIPTEHLLEITRSGSLEQLSNQEMEDLLNQIIKEYINQFITNYSDFNFLDIIVGQFQHYEYDYFELVDILSITVQNMISYVSALRELSPDFRSPTTGMTFGDIFANLDLLLNIDVRRLSALIHTTNMSRNRYRAASILEYDILRMEHELARLRSNIADTLYIVRDVYEAELWLFTYMEEHLIFDRHPSVYEDMLRLTINSMQQANELEAAMAFYQLRVNNLRYAYGNVSLEDVLFVENNIPNLFDRLAEWEQTINLTANDFLTLELFSDAIRVMSPASMIPIGVNRQMVILIMLIGAVAGFVLGSLIALYRGNKKEITVEV